MKKAIGIIILGLLWCNISFAECIKGDCITGPGAFNFPSGNKYVGEFKNGLKNGQGTVTWVSGAKYVGRFKNDKQHGQGIYMWANGDKYVGEFKKDEFHGKGTVTQANGTIITGIFKRGELVKKISTDTSAKDKSDKKMELASMIDDAKKTCKELGFKEGTEKFTDCSLKLYSQSVELASKNNQQVVMQPQSSGSNVMTIYDPVRDNRALMNQGQRMLSGACTLGINC